MCVEPDLSNTTPSAPLEARRHRQVDLPLGFIFPPFEFNIFEL